MQGGLDPPVALPAVAPTLLVAEVPLIEALDTALEAVPVAAEVAEVAELAPVAEEATEEEPEQPAAEGNCTLTLR